MDFPLSVPTDSVDYYVRLLPKPFQALVKTPLSRIPLWTQLAWMEVVQSYRRTLLGPLWITLNLVIFTVAMTLVYGALFSVPTREYAAFLACGMIGWVWVGALLTDVGNTFINYSPFIKGTPINKSLFIWTTVFKLVITLCHHMIVWLGLVFLGVIDLSIYSLFTVPAVIVLFLFSIPITGVAGILFTRYRDLQRLLQSMIVVLMMITPIFWQTSMVSGWRTAFFYLNPVYYLVEFLRAPLLGQREDPVVLAVILGMLCLAWIFGARFYQRYEKYVVFWM
jgi:ABC-type polysaccharide/polyol phosphate export permease